MSGTANLIKYGAICYLGSWLSGSIAKSWAQMHHLSTSARGWLLALLLIAWTILMVLPAWKLWLGPRRDKLNRK